MWYTKSATKNIIFRKLDILPIKVIPFSTCYTSRLLNRWESYVFTSAKFAEISKFLVYYRPQSVPKYFRCLDLYTWRSLTWKSVLGSVVGVCIACNFCSFLANKGLIWHVVHKICKRIGAASYCTICTVGGAASLTRPLAEEIYTLKTIWPT